LSSSLNSSAAAAVNDFYLPTLAAPAPGRLLRASRLMTVVFGLLQVGVGMGAYWLALDQSVVYSVLSIAAFASGLILGVFFLGVLTNRVTQRAALVGLVGGCAILSAVAFGTEINGLWYTVVGSLATVAVGLAVAWIERVVRG
jgi:SSS family solute:Na+ symporter